MILKAFQELSSYFLCSSKFLIRSSWPVYQYNRGSCSYAIVSPLSSLIEKCQTAFESVLPTFRPSRYMDHFDIELSNDSSNSLSWLSKTHCYLNDWKQSTFWVWIWPNSDTKWTWLEWGWQLLTLLTQKGNIVNKQLTRQSWQMPWRALQLVPVCILISTRSNKDFWMNVIVTMKVQMRTFSRFSMCKIKRIEIAIWCT